MYFKLICIVILLINLNMCDSGETDTKTDITAGPPPHDKPWVPGWGWFANKKPTSWRSKHRKYVKQSKEKQKDIKIVFFGDSKIARWTLEGLDVWNEYYPKINGYNYGIRGDSTRQVLWRIDNKELDGLEPKIFVFMIGGNNFKSNYNKGTDEEIVKAETIIMDKVRQKLPKTQIIFVGQLPRGGSTDARARNIDVLLEKALKTDYTFVHFFKIYNNFTNSDGSQNKSLYIEDNYHLNKDGYRVLAKLLEPLITKYL